MEQENLKNTNTELSKKPKTLNGVVISNKMKDTVVVEVTRYRKHRRYGKYVRIQKKYKAHDAGNTKNIGDSVVMIPSKPISKDKKFIVIS